MGGLDRRLLIPCDEATPSSVLYATMGGLLDERQERGPAPGVAVRDPDNQGKCELLLCRRGAVPVVRHVEGDVRVHVSGDIERGRMIWRRRGDPYYRGKSDYADIAQSMCVRQSTAAYMQHPKLLAMSNGELLIVWAEHASANVDDENWNWYARVLDPRTYRLGPIVTFPAVTSGGVSVDRDQTPAAVPSIDAAEDPAHPGRIVAVGVAETANLSVTGSQLDAVTFTSTDYGRTWTIQAITPEFTAGSDDGYGLAIEYVGSRLALLLHTRTTGLTAYYSNDHGSTWMTASVNSSQPAQKAGYLDLVVTKDGQLVGLLASEGVQAGQMWWSGDGGANWQAFTDVGVGNGNPRSVALFVDDSGFPGFYQYSNISGSTKSLHVYRAGVRSITLAEVTKATNVFDDTSSQTEERAVYDDFTDSTDDPSIERIAATNWRGRIVLLVYYNDAARRSLSIHFAGQWSDLRYSTLHQTADSYASWYWLYKPYDAPDTLGASGYAWTAAGTTAGNSLVEGGGWELVDSGAAQDRYTSPALNTSPRAIRFLVRVLQGGSVSADTIMLQVADATNDWRFGIRLATTGFQCRDVNGAASVGPAISTDLTQWHEFVFSFASPKSLRQVFWRKLDPENDGEHPATNELLAASATLDSSTPEGTDQITFFHASGANGISEWREIAQQRSATANPGPTPADPPVVRWDPEDAFQLYSAGLTGGQFRTSDKGPQLSDLPMDLADGLCVRWSGAAAIHGDRWDIATRAEFARSLIMEGGPTRGWASERAALSGTDAIAIVLDAGQDRKFRADALAVFGCNAPFLSVEANDADDWTSPQAQLIGLVTDNGAPGQYFAHAEKIRGNTGAAGAVNILSIDGNCVKLTQTAGFELGPHQFRPRGTREWYLVTQPDNAAFPGHVWRIEDNAADALYLSDAPTAAQMVAGDACTIFSDRFLVDLGAISGWDRSVGYRFLRLLFSDLNTGSGTFLHVPNEPYLKVGRVVPGRLADLSDPEWGFTRRLVPNVNYARSRGGQVRARRGGPALEEWALTWGNLPPQIRDELNVLGDAEVWQVIRDLVSAAEFGARSVVLVPDGSAIAEQGWARASGDDLVLVRPTGVLNLQHDAYYPIENCGEDASDVIGDIYTLGGVTFAEEA